MDVLFTNVAAGRLSGADAVVLAEGGRTRDACSLLLDRIGVVMLARNMAASSYFVRWQCEWLAWQAIGSTLGAGESDQTGAPEAVENFDAQMPLHAQVLRYGYRRWLERKEWGLGELMSNRKDDHAPAFELRIPALLISQFDAVFTWIGDHDRGLQLH